MVARKQALRLAPLIIALGMGGIFAVLNWVQEEQGWRDWFGYKLELKVLDNMFEWRGPVETSAQVAIAAFDERSIEAFGVWGSWDRRVFARAIANLLRAGTDTIGLDVVFADELGEGDSAEVRGLESVLRAADLEGTTSFIKTETGAAGAQLASIRTALEQARAPAQAWRERLQMIEDRLQAIADRVGHFEELSGSLQEIMQTAGQSADEVLAAAIEEHSGNVVLGYVALRDAEEEELSRTIEQSFEVVSGSALDDIAVGWGVPSEGEEVAVPVYSESVRIDDDLKVPAIKGGFVVPLPKMAEAAENFGYFSVGPDADGICRRLPLVYRYGHQLLPSLALSTASILLEGAPVPVDHPFIGHGLESVSFVISDDVIERLCERSLPADRTRCVAEFRRDRIARSVIARVPTTPMGEMLVNYYGPENTTFPRISFVDIVNDNFDHAAVRGKVVLFAATAMATFDQRVTPFNSFVPGVEIHAAGIQNIIDGRFLRRPSYAAAVEMAGMLLLALILGLLLPRVSITPGVVATMAIAIGYWAINTFVLFRQGYWFYQVIPMSQIMMTWGAITAFGYLTEGREKRRITEQFGTYVSPEYVKELIDKPDMIGLSGEERELTVLFSDIRGFTTMSERMAPEELTGFLNEYLTPMTHVLQRHLGTLDKYMGDAIMAFFGAPKWFEDHAVQGCLTAVEMMDELHALQQKWRGEGKPEIDIGIGLNSGKMRVGNMGSAAMRNYTILGDNVNLGSRLEGINKQYATNIIVSESTFRAAIPAVYGRELDFVAVKGKKEPVRIFEIMGKGEPPAWQRELISCFEEGLAAYRRQSWDVALEKFRNCMALKREAIRQSDATSQTYLERVQLLQENPPGEGWDGVWVMTTK